MVIIEEDDYLAHFGILRKSGRYPWGSGEDPQARGHQFHETVAKLRAEGMTDPEIAKTFGMSSGDLRSTRTIANNAIKAADIAMAQRLKDKGYSDAAGARRMGIPGTTYRALIAPGELEKAEKLTNICNELRGHVADKTLVDIGSGSENYMGIAETRLKAAVAVLKDEGYVVHKIPITQLGTGKVTQTKVLAAEGTTWGWAKKNQNMIQQINSWSDDQGKTFSRLQQPLSMHPDRIAIMWREQGGAEQDGMIYARPGVKDVSLENSRYAQVRVLVGKDHYLKGMAVYKDNLPPGVDLMFATNKANTGNKFDAMKKIDHTQPQLEENNPFGSSLKRQILERDAKGDEHVTSVMNIVNEQGDWAKWSKSISSQVLSKQKPSLAKQQLEMTLEKRQKEFDTIQKLTNPTVRRELLKKFAEETDGSAVQLDAAALNRDQAYHIILPMNTLPPHQVYAPRYKDGEVVALIRYPHGGTFEIPELVVNNSHPEGKRILGDVPDAIGIHHSVAERLSGADFDGDQVVVVPNRGRKQLTVTPALEGLKGFDPKAAYPKYDGMKPMTKAQKQSEMGIVSNLITDMTLQNAPIEHVTRAIKHSMVVIDAEKHELNFRQSAIDNGIPALKAKYQRDPISGKIGGASTLISRARSEQHQPETRARRVSEGGPIDPVTGKAMTVPTGRLTVNAKGETILKTEKKERLAITDNAHELSSGTPMETIYANHSNSMKSLANQARKAMIETPRLNYSQSAAKAYAPEVASLNAKLALAISNRPKERQAQVVGNALYRAKIEANPNVDDATKRKFKNQALTEARTRTGATSKQIVFEPAEWNAIQAGAITDHKLTQMLQKADIRTVRELATPTRQVLMTATKTGRAQRMLADGYTRADVARALGVSLSTLDVAMNG